MKWLNRAKLDRIVERVNDESAAPEEPRDSKYDDGRAARADTHDDRHDGRDGKSRKKKGGLLGDILGGLGGE